MMKYTHSHDINKGGTVHMMKAHKPLGKHIPPHERKALIHIDFSDDDMMLFKHIYGDEDEAAAAATGIDGRSAGAFRFLSAQLFRLIEEVA